MCQENLIELRLQFALRLYQFARNSFLEDLNADFPVLSKFKNYAAKHFFAGIASLPKNQWPNLAIALVKRAHFEAIQSLNDSVTGEDVALFDLYRTEGERSLYIPAFDPLPGEMRKSELRKALAALAKRRPWGTLVKADEPSAVMAERIFASYRIKTYFSTGGKFGGLHYWHEIKTEDGRNVAEALSCLGWFGISGMTYWHSVRECELDDVLDCIDAACALFFNALPQLTE